MSGKDGLPKQLLPILKVYKNLLGTLLSSDKEDSADAVQGDDADPTNKLLAPTVINAISAVVLALPPEHEVTSKVRIFLLLPSPSPPSGTGKSTFEQDVCDYMKNYIYSHGQK